MNGQRFSSLGLCLKKASIPEKKRLLSRGELGSGMKKQGVMALSLS